ncbi:Gmad2 immunoglobulin-like domain-containing protein [Nocardioides sp. LHG3406-4]|uniref:Gmad2 immunoglobulin-like domain-containing protein n=1 Tax=Nocardioides sp. LHG3406-4 TaxID=2804575 RepID=UPI003CF03516
MPIITQVKVHHPVKSQLVGRRFVVAGVGSGFEGTIGLRVLDSRGRELAVGSAQSAGGMAGMGEFSATLTMASPPRNGARVTLQAFGDNPGLPDEGPSPGFDLVEVPLIVFPGLQGWILYRVASGDTLTSIRRDLRPYTSATVAHIVAANPRIDDPDVIKVGWKLRVPQLG